MDESAMNDQMDNPTHILGQVEFLVERRRYEQARALLGTALANYPDDSELLFQVALIDFRTDRNADALNVVNDLLARDPQHYGARNLAFAVHKDMENFVEAEQHIISLLRDYPEEAPLYAKYALLMFATQHLDKGRELAHEAARLDPADDTVLTANTIADLIDGLTGKRAVNLAELLREHPESLATALLLVNDLIQRGRYWTAKRMARELLQSQPDSRVILDLLLNLNYVTHWSMWPMLPTLRYGWGGAVIMYVFFMLLITVLSEFTSGVANTGYVLFLVYVIYSWTYPPLFKRWLFRGQSTKK